MWTPEIYRRLGHIQAPARCIHMALRGLIILLVAVVMEKF